MDKEKAQNKLWIMFDRARKERPNDYLLSMAILEEIDRFNDKEYKELN